MRVLIGKDENDWQKKAWTWIHEEIKPGARVFVPAGGTPQALYQRWTAEPTSLLKSLTLVQIDEIISGPEKGHFRKFFETELPAFKNQMEWIERAEGLAEAAILGVGVNGHVAFHEPGLPRHFQSGCVRLSQETMNYIGLKEPTWGLTYGVGAFAKAKKILVLVKGPHKQAVMKLAMRAHNLPISWILEHPNVTVVSNFELSPG
jgi:6-phosphogluconolactonase/glucosamine-6-phosphate isomerase/deaminase